MTAKEVVLAYRTQSMALLKAMDYIKDHEISEKELKAICLMIMNLYAEFIWNTADVVEDLSDRFKFELHNTKSINPIDLNEPPFEKDFFRKRR